MTQPTNRRGWAIPCGVILIALACLALGAAPALADDFTWSGAGTPSSTCNCLLFSDSSNWHDGAAPSGSAGTLSFPSLGDCPTSAQAPLGCYGASNDETGLSADGISIADTRYDMFGKSLTLGDGGITVTNPGGTPTSGPFVGFPIVLGAPQTWSIDGGAGLFARGQLSGAEPLTVDLQHQSSLDVGVDASAEVGAVSVNGGDPSSTGESAGANGTIFPGQLNDTSGSTIELADAGLHATNSRVGPLTSTGGLIDISDNTDTGALSVGGALTLDSASAVNLHTVNGLNSLLAATGNVDLGGALLEFLSGTCNYLEPAGTVNTLVRTNGTLQGTFGGLPDGAATPLSCEGNNGVAQGATVQWFRINYTASSVTATSLGSQIPSSHTSLSANPPYALVNQQVVLAATVQTSFGNPSGTVRFTVDGTVVPGCGSQPVNNVSGSYQANCTTSFSKPGSHKLQATFVPSPGEGPSSSPSIAFKVRQGGGNGPNHSAACVYRGRASGSIRCTRRRPSSRARLRN